MPFACPNRCSCWCRTHRGIPEIAILRISYSWNSPWSARGKLVWPQALPRRVCTSHNLDNRDAIACQEVSRFRRFQRTAHVLRRCSYAMSLLSRRWYFHTCSASPSLERASPSRALRAQAPLPWVFSLLLPSREISRSPSTDENCLQGGRNLQLCTSLGELKEGEAFQGGSLSCL